jgi:methylmalonyl-CoA/ethylmalonyl-CoA epimerase
VVDRSTNLPGGRSHVLDRIDHIAMAVHRAEDVLGYFTDTLGLAVVHDEVIDAAGVRLVYLDAGNTFIQLAEPVGEGAIATFLEERGQGLHHICFAVGDVSDALDAIPGQDGLPVSLGGRGRRTCFLRDTPAGLVVELTEEAPVPATARTDGFTS